MQRRTFLSFLGAGTVLVACGSDSTGDETADDETTGVSLPPVTEAPAVEPPRTEPPADDSIDPTVPIVGDEDGVVLVLTYEGGLTTRSSGFANPPVITVTDDGRLFTVAAAEQSFPGPLVVGSQEVRPITTSGIGQLLAAARTAGLLADVEYESDELLADASTATLRITADGETYQHAAYALDDGGGLGGGGEAAGSSRKTLSDFISTVVDDLESVVNPAELGAPEPWEPEAYQLFAEATPDASSDEDVTIVGWPATTDVVLADTSECTEVPAAAVASVLSDADELTFFTQADVTYQVFARPAYPGRSC